MNAERHEAGPPCQERRPAPPPSYQERRLSHSNTKSRNSTNIASRSRTRSRLRTSDFLIRVACIFACLVGISAAIRGAISAPYADGAYFLIAIAGAFALVLLHVVWGRS